MPRVGASKIIPWLLVGVLVLIAYGSLYPFNLKDDAIRGGVLHALGQLSWARADRSDRISNVLLYLPLGFCLFLWLGARLRRLPALVVATLLGSAYSLSIEVAQVYISMRVPSLTDLSLNALGSGLGAIGGLVWRIGALWMHLPQRMDKPQRDFSAVLLLALWIVWRFAPFIPHADLGKLKAALRPLFDPELNAALIFAYLTCWLVVSQALGAIVSRARLLEALLVLIAVVLAGQLLLAEQAFVPSELAALILLLPLLVLTDRLSHTPRKALLGCAVLLVFLGYRLDPLVFDAAPQAFDFWPFQVWLEQDAIVVARSIDWNLVFGEIFMFALVSWTLLYCGASIKLAAGSMLALALITEVAQLWLAGRTASATDPALALLVAMAFWYTERRDGLPAAQRSY